MIRALAIAVLVAIIKTSSSQCVSTTLASTFARYDCDDAAITTYATTFTAANFPTAPEELYINDITSKRIPAASFNGMSTITNNTFGAVANTVPKLFMTCVRNNYLYFTNDSIVGLDYVEWFGIRQCLLLSIDPGTFGPLGTLYSFDISLGHIGNLNSDSFSGIQMISDRRMYGSGTVNITSPLPTLNVLPSSVFAPFDGATHINLNGLNIETIPADAFGTQSALMSLNLTENKHINTPEGLFDGMSVISYVEMYGVQFTCDCTSNIWLIDWAKTYHVRLLSDYRCNNMVNSLVRYKKDECDKPHIGFWLLDVYWYGAEKILLWLLNFFSFFTAIAALVILDKARLKPKLRRRPPAKDPRKPRPKGLKRAADKVRRMQRKLNVGWG